VIDLPGYDRWLCDGPRVYCDGCGASLGRLHDGRGERVGGERLCGDCVCPACEGEGALMRPYLDGVAQVHTPCPDCDGTGGRVLTPKGPGTVLSATCHVRLPEES